MNSFSRARLLSYLAGSAAAVVPAGTLAATPPIRIATAVGDSYASPYYVSDGGFLGRKGLTADVTLFTNGGAVMQAVIGRSDDIGLADPTQLANAVVRGIPLTFFAGGGLYRSEAPTTVMCVAKNSPIKKPKDLEGQTIALIALRSVTEIAVRRWMAANDVDAAKVKLFEMPSSDTPGALVRGTVAAGVLPEPTLSAALSSGDVVAFAKPFDAIAKRFYIASWFATRDWLSTDPRRARDLTEAIYAAANWANGHPELSAPILVKYSKLNPASVRTMTRVTMSTSLDAKLIQPVLDAAAQFGLIPKRIDATDLMTTA